MAALGTFSSVAGVVLGRTLSDALLLSARPAINVANFFIVSSVALMCVSLVYFGLLRVVSATKLNLAFLFFSALGAVASRLVHIDGQTAILSYATFLITAPALGNIIVWSAIGDAFDARQGRRLFNLVCAASTLGGIAAGCIIPAMIRVFGFPALPIADGLTFCLMAVPVIGLRRRRRQEKTQFSVTSEGKRRMRDDFIYAARDIIRSPLLKNLCFIFFLTALATNIIDFVLKQYLQTNFDREGIAIFYGHFNAVSNTFNLVVQLTVLSQFLMRFKTRALFALTPAVLLVFTVPFVFVYTAFCVVALRFVDVAMRFTVQDAAREIAISSLPRLLRNRSKVIFKGVMNPLGGICAGFLLNIAVPCMNYKYTPLLLIPVIGVTLYFVRDLNRYSADHLYKQLKLVSLADGGKVLPNSDDASPGGGEPISYDPSMLMDDSPMAREATLDAILISRNADIRTHSNIQRCAMACVAHEVRLAQASLVVLQALNDISDSEADAEHRSGISNFADDYSPSAGKCELCAQHPNEGAAGETSNGTSPAGEDAGAGDRWRCFEAKESGCDLVGGSLQDECENEENSDSEFECAENSGCTCELEENADFASEYEDNPDAINHPDECGGDPVGGSLQDGFEGEINSAPESDSEENSEFVSEDEENADLASEYEDNTDAINHPDECGGEADKTPAMKPAADNRAICADNPKCASKSEFCAAVLPKIASAVQRSNDADAVSEICDAAVYRIFKSLMAVYRRDMIQTIFQSLTSSRASTRAQALELLQLTLTNTPYAKRILIFCDDFNVEEKVVRLDEIEHMTVGDALGLMGEENDRKIRKLVAKLDTLLHA